MRKLITLLLTTLCLGSSGQLLPGTLTAPLGLTFRQSKEQVKEILTARGGVLDPTYSKPNSYIFDKLKLGNRATEFVAVKFYQNQLYFVDIYFSPLTEPGIFDLFDEIRGNVSQKYGDGNYERKFTGVYEDGDGYELTAIKLGYANMVCSWYFINGYIGAEITSDLMVNLYYADGELTGIKLKEQKNQNSKDY